MHYWVLFIWLLPLNALMHTFYIVIATQHNILRICVNVCWRKSITEMKLIANQTVSPKA